MFLSTFLKKLLFGKTVELNKSLNNRAQTIVFPATSEDEEELSVKFRTDDGLILHLLKRITKLENEMRKLRTRNK